MKRKKNIDTFQDKSSNGERIKRIEYKGEENAA